MSWFDNYLERTRQPWACVALVVPMIAVYEMGLFFLGPAAAGRRTGADAWLSHAAAHVGLTVPFLVPFFLTAGLISWAIAARQPFRDPVGAWLGMIGESVLFAGLFFVVVQILFPMLAFFGERVHDVSSLLLQSSPSASPSASPSVSPEFTWEAILGFLGAGIYEETIFRLIGFSLLRWLLLTGDLGEFWSDAFAALGSSLLFAGAHHWGHPVDSVNATIFLYRMLAGVYFAGLFQTRGFGVAVGAHAGYDVFVGLVLR